MQRDLVFNPPVVDSHVPEYVSRALPSHSADHKDYLIVVHRYLTSSFASQFEPLTPQTSEHPLLATM